MGLRVLVAPEVDAGTYAPSSVRSPEPPALVRQESNHQTYRSDDPAAQRDSQMFAAEQRADPERHHRAGDEAVDKRNHRGRSTQQ